MRRFDILLLLSKCIFTVVHSGDNCWLLVTATKSYASQFINVMKKTWIRNMCPHCRWSATRPPRGSPQRTSSSASGSRVWSSSSRTNSGWAGWAGWGTGCRGSTAATAGTMWYSPPANSSCSSNSRWWVIVTLELQTKVRKDFTITEKAPTRAFSFSHFHI